MDTTPEPVRAREVGPSLARGTRLVRGWRSGLDALWSVVFPERCAGCGVFETQLCDPCRSALVPVGSDVCRRCGHPQACGPVGSGYGARSAPPVPAAGFCPRCAGLDVEFATARSAYVYEGVARRLVREFKYEGRRNLAPLLAGLSSGALHDVLRSVGLSPAQTLVSWVPAHSSTIRSRGYNQAEVLARELTRAIGGPAAVPLVRKASRTRHQRTLSRAERRRNLLGAFVPLALPDGRDAAKGVVLVDDVYTTGATAQEVAGVVGRVTKLPVHVFTFCRTVDAGDGSIS